MPCLLPPHPNPLPPGEREECGGGTGRPSPQPSPTRGEGALRSGENAFALFISITPRPDGERRVAVPHEQLGLPLTAEGAGWAP